MTDLGRSLRLRLEPDTTAVRVVRSVIRRLFQFPHLDDEQSFLIAVSEIFANAVDEHQRRAVTEPIEVTLRFGRHPLVEISDRGNGVDGSRLYTPSSDAHDGGHGLAIARALVSELSIRSSGDGTTVRLWLPQDSPIHSAGNSTSETARSGPLVISTIEDGVGRAVLRLEGAFDRTEIGAFEEAATRIDGSVVVDLTSVGLIDSSAIGALVRLRRRIGSGGHTMTTVVESPVHERLFRITAVWEYFGGRISESTAM